MTNMATMAIGNGRQGYLRGFRMRSLWMCLCCIVVSTSQVFGYPFQTTLSFVDGKWEDDTILCMNESYVIEITAIRARCNNPDYSELTFTQFNFLKQQCQARTNCSTSDNESTRILTINCENGDLVILIQGNCALVSSLFRICSSGTTDGSGPISVYGPLVSTIKAQQMCSCVIETTAKLNIDLVIFWHGEVEFDISSEDKNMSWSSPNIANVEKYEISLMDVNGIYITLSSQNSGDVESFFLYLNGEEAVQIQCFNSTSRDDMPSSNPGLATSVETTSENYNIDNTDMAQDAGGFKTNGIIILIAVIVTLVVIIIIAVAVCAWKRKKTRRKDKHPEVSEMINPQCSDSSTFQSVPNGSMGDDSFLSTDNNENGKKVASNLQNSYEQTETEFQKTDNNSTGGLNELYGSTESGIAVSTEPDPEGNVENNTIKKGKDLYDEALPVSHDPKVYKPSVFPGDSQISSARPYYLYDDSHKKPTVNQTGSNSGSSGDNTFCPEILDYAPSYLKTKGGVIKTLKPLTNQTPMNIANGSAQSLQAYSYADTRGRFVEGITPHIVGQGYDVEKPLPDDKYEQFQSPGGTNKVNLTGSKTNLGPYSYAACSVNPNPTGDLRPPADISLGHYESMNAINKPKESDNNAGDTVKNDIKPPAEYEGIEFAGKGQKPVIINGMEMVENEVYSKE